MSFGVSIVVGDPQQEEKCGKEKRRSTKALTTVDRLRDRVQIYWYGSKRNRFRFPLDDSHDGWITYEDEKKLKLHASNYYLSFPRWATLNWIGHSRFCGHSTSRRVKRACGEQSPLGQFVRV